MKKTSVIEIILCLFVSSFMFGASGDMGAGTEPLTDGSANYPYLIEDLADFDEFASDPNYWDDHTRLDVDIDLIGRTYATAVIAPDISPSDDFQGTPFTGVFDGNGFSIINLTIDNINTNHLGLFGLDNDSSIIKNIKLENCTITCEESYHVGGLIGENYGLVMNCSSSGRVTCWGSFTSEDIGGLVGYNLGTITHCYSSVDVDGEAWNSGGLAGKNNGQNGQGIIDNCYATGSVTAYRDAGGLVGENEENSLVRNCYSTGVVTGTITRGGLIGNASTGGSTQNSFWDTMTSNQTTSAGGTGKTTAEMKTVGTFLSAGWDLVSSWNIEEDQTYPLLRKYLAVDTNYDNMVNLVDFVEFANHWLEGVE